MAEKLRDEGTNVWVPTLERLHPARGQAGCWVQEGITPSHCEGPGITPRKFLKTQMLNPTFWISGDLL